MADGSVRLLHPGQALPVNISPSEVRRASYGLVYDRPEWSCSSKVRHRSGLVVMFLLAGCAGLFQPMLFLMALNAVIVALFTVLIAMRAALVLRGAALRAEATFQEPVADLTEPEAERQDWPVYSVLVPLYREANSIARLVKSLKSIDYPEDKIEVMFMIEAEDIQTRSALQKTRFPAHWRVLSLPNGIPRTKPRALNVALGRLHGEIATIYDAEDHPHPAQLKAAVRALEAGGGAMACVQAPLQAYNGRASWVAGQWAFEYDVHFGLILPALAKAGRPIALGGTSNHFRVSALAKAGGWDAWNVTEDADIGLRFARLGYIIGTITEPTLEEAPEKLSIWVPQRSRWIKGYMQSGAVMMRRPFLAIRQMGFSAFLSSQILLGGSILSALLHGPLMILCLLCLLVPGLSLSPASICLLVVGYLVHTLAAVLAPGQKGWRRVFLTVTAPFYWPLQSIAAARSLYELATCPHLWSKTPHALTRISIDADSLAYA